MKNLIIVLIISCNLVFAQWTREYGDPDSNESSNIVTDLSDGYCVLGKKDTVAEFKKLLKIKGIKDKHIIEKQGGVVPIYSNRLRTYSESPEQKVYLVGDAACQVKATTGGGIIQGLTAAKCLADSIIYNRDYEKEWKKKLGKDLWLHLAARRVMDRFSYDDWNRLIDIFSKKKNKQILERFDRDYPSRFFLKLALQEPRLWGFARKLF